MSAALQAYKARLDALEEMRIPTLEERLQEVSRNSAEVHSTACKATLALTSKLNLCK